MSPLLSRRLSVFLSLFVGGVACARASADEKPLPVLAREQFTFAAQQYAGLLERLKDQKVEQPKTLENGRFRTVPARDWTSGFFPGSLWLIYEQTQDPVIRAAAENFTARLEPLRKFTGHHDIGFMINCSYGHGYRLTGNPAYREMMIQGARNLSTRFNAKTGVIRSWDFGKWRYPVIVDNMMNLELLLWAHEQTKEASFRDIALSHANKTLENHFRPDGSSVHLVEYDQETGAVLKRQTVQGYADESSWARGQGWGLYGFTTMAAMTKDPAYLAQAEKIADFVTRHPRLPADGIPYWDFDAPRIPDALRDASAGAIICSALLQLSELVPAEAGARYRAVAERQLRTLCTAAFRAGLGENGHFLLMHSVGHIPEKREIDVPLNYADYYFLEALSRYLAMAAKPSPSL